MRKATKLQKRIELLKLDFARWMGRRGQHYRQTQKLNKDEARYLEKIRTSNDSPVAESLSMIGVDDN